eukprot:3238353-Rhodomonas_salina.2
MAVPDIAKRRQDMTCDNTGHGMIFGSTGHRIAKTKYDLAGTGHRIPTTTLSRSQVLFLGARYARSVPGLAAPFTWSDSTIR